MKKNKQKQLTIDEAISIFCPDAKSIEDLYEDST